MSISPLLSLLLVFTPQATAQSELHCYPFITQIGTAALREFRDDNGFVVKAIYYVSTSVENMKPSGVDEHLRELRISTYQRDALGRVLLETTVGAGVTFVRRHEYVGDNKQPSRETVFNPDETRRSEIRHGPGDERLSLQFNEQQRVTGITGRLPDDLDLAFEWGPQADGWRCGLSLAPRHSGEDTLYINLHLLNVSAPAANAAVVGSFETELRNEHGTIVPPVEERNYPSRSVSGRPGSAGYKDFDLPRRYGKLPPGRYSLQVHVARKVLSRFPRAHRHRRSVVRFLTTFCQPTIWRQCSRARCLAR